jgi:hypothetical protein
LVGGFTWVFMAAILQWFELLYTHTEKNARMTAIAVIGFWFQNF